MQLGTKVKVTHGLDQFTGIVNRIEKWKNPISKVTGVNYVVEADDDGMKYRCPSNIVTKISTK